MTERYRGRQQVTNRRDVRTILRLVNASSEDIFCDLGCGDGNVCRWSLEVVKHAIGVEDDKKRYRKALNNTKKYNVKILNKSYADLKTFRNLYKCSIFYCVNEEGFDIYEKIEKIAERGTYVVSFLFPPYPIKPEKFDGLFYAVRTPYQLAKNEKEWIYSLTKNGSLGELKKRYSTISSDWEELLLDLHNQALGFDWIYKKRKMKRT